jgi:hypothetical protein
VVVVVGCVVVVVRGTVVVVVFGTTVVVVSGTVVVVVATWASVVVVLSAAVGSSCCDPPPAAKPISKAASTAIAMNQPRRQIGKLASCGAGTSGGGVGVVTRIRPYLYWHQLTVRAKDDPSELPGALPGDETARWFSSDCQESSPRSVSAVDLSAPLPSLRSVTRSGPSHLGRSVVVDAEQATPELWDVADNHVIARRRLDDLALLGETVHELTCRYVDRIPTVFVLDIDSEELNQPETTGAPPYELGGEFTFLRERLTKLIWHNSYDARSGELIWWWAHKAEARLDVAVGGPADVLTADGTPIWIDGGPRQPLDVDGLVHHESIELGTLTPVPKPTALDADLAPDQLDAVSIRSGCYG